MVTLELGLKDEEVGIWSRMREKTILREDPSIGREKEA